MQANGVISMDVSPRYNLGFVIYTASSLVLTLDPLTGEAGALWLIIGRLSKALVPHS
jgi:hypothetical protein